MNNTRFLALAFLLLGTSSAVAQDLSDEARFTEALRQAQDENKGVAVYFYSDTWRTPHDLEAVLPDDWSVQTYLDRLYVPVAIDADSEQGAALAKRYANHGQFPVLALVRQTGELQGFQVIDLDNREAGPWAKFFLQTELLTGRFSKAD